MVLCLATMAPACGAPGQSDTEEEGDSDDEEDTTSGKNEDTDKETTTSTTGDSSTKSEDTTTDDTSDEDSSGDTGPLLGKCDRTLTPTLTVSDDLESSVTWSGVVKLSGEVKLRDDVILIISAGTTILADPGAKLVVGQRIYDSALVAQGDASAPIHFCGSTDSPGSWEGIELGDKTQASSVLSHVSIENAGVEDGAALTVEAAVKLEQVEIYGSAAHGIIADGFGADSKNLRIETCKVAALLGEPAAVQSFPADSVIKDNADNAVEFSFDSIESEINFRNLGAPYRQLKDLRLRDNAKMVLQAGVQYEVAPRRRIEVGDFRGASELRCEGTEAEPVEIRGQEASAGTWRGISVGRDSTATTTFVHTTIRHGGDNSRASLQLERSIKVDHLSIEDALNGVQVERAGFAAGSEHLSVKNTKGYAVRVRAEAVVGLPAGGTFENNERSVVWVERGDIESSGTIVKMPVPYHIEGSVRLGRGVDLVVAPGTEFRMGKRADLVLDPRGDSSSVLMKGTDSERIKFMGQEASAGYWGSVRAGEELKDSSAFEYVEFAHGGSGRRDGMLDLERTFPVQNCVFSQSGGYGISRDRKDSTDYTKDNEFKDNKEGAVGSY